MVVAKAAVIPIVPVGDRAAPSPMPATWLARLGEAMRRHRRIILAIQWVVIVFYVVLVTVPAFLPLPETGATIVSNLTLAAQFVFWGIWWPFVIFTTLFAGRVWCGVFCPEGALAEHVSRFGLNRRVPKFIRWSGWPFVAFILTTVYGQLVSVYEYAQAALLVLGGSTLAAIAVGFLYGREKRVWCRYLCPVSGVFSLLGRVAPLQFKVDRQVWREHRPNFRLECAPLVDVKGMTGSSDCHLCGQCSGFREAVHLTARLPGSEVAQLPDGEVSKWDARLVVFGMLGVAVGAFQWSSSPWFVMAKQALAEWLVDREWFGPLESDIPWWILTHYPEAGDVFTWLDGALVLGYIGAMALVVGTWISLWLALAGQLTKGPGDTWRHAARRLAYTLTPLAGLGIFLGLSALTVTLLKAEGLRFPWLGSARGMVLAVGVLWSLGLAWRQLHHRNAPLSRMAAAFTCMAMAVVPVVGSWMMLFYVW